jgi:hypothetical protein
MAVMRRYLIIGLAICLILLSGLTLLSSLFQAKLSALGDVGQTLVEADYHYLAIVECGGRVLKAKHNLPVIRRAAEYIATTGSNTQVYRQIARLAAQADHECERLEAVLDLAVRRTSESRPILTLAAMACAPLTPEQDAAWQRIYDALAVSAEYPSVEAALAGRRAEQ